MEFCSCFDETLAHSGPAAVFLPDQEGKLRFDARWTRDNWGRAPGPHAIQWRWTLFRDRRSGFVFLALVTSPTLIPQHPRLQLRTYDSFDEANAARAAFGSPSIAAKGWE